MRRRRQRRARAAPEHQVQVAPLDAEGDVGLSVPDAFPSKRAVPETVGVEKVGHPVEDQQGWRSRPSPSARVSTTSGAVVGPIRSRRRGDCLTLERRAGLDRLAAGGGRAPGDRPTGASRWSRRRCGTGAPRSGTAPAAGRRRRRRRRTAAPRDRSTRQTASDTYTLAIEVSCRPGSPRVEQPRRSCDDQRAAVSMSITESAIISWAMPSPPAASRTARARRRGPARCRARGARGRASACSGSAAPGRAAPGRSGSPRRPRRARRRRRRGSRSKRDLACPPAKPRSMRRGSCGPTSSPGLSMSTRNIVAPAVRRRPSVRAITMQNAAPSAPVMNRLRPSISQPPPTRVGASSAARPGPSRRPGAARSSRSRSAPRRRPAARRYRSFCSGVAIDARACACCPRRAPCS